MHNYPAFEMQEQAERIAFVRQRRFGTLIINGPDGPVAAHLPMLLRDDPGDNPDRLILEGHVARSNPLGALAAQGGSALAIFNGADAYVAAGFYPSKQIHGKVAPTWNYLAVHVTGPITVFSDANGLTDHLTRLTDFLEADESEPWAVADAPEGFTDRLVTAITGLSIQVSLIEGIAKLSQNSRPEDRDGVIAGLTRRGDPMAQRIVDQMRES